MFFSFGNHFSFKSILAGCAGSSWPDNTITVCGGNWVDDFFDETILSECFTLTNGQWESFGQLKTARQSHGASMIRNAIWFTGGRSEHNYYCTGCNKKFISISGKPK